MKRTSLLTMAIGCGLLLAAGAAYPKAKVDISYLEIGPKYRIIGPLGVELGKVLELEVEKVETRTKENPTVLQVNSIGGKALAKPVLLPYRMLVTSDRFALNRKIKVKAYQDGSFGGTPAEVLKDTMIPTTDYGFEVALVVYKYLN